MQDLVHRTWKSYRVLSHAPEQLKPVCSETLLMMGVWRLVDEYTQENQLSGMDKRKLRELTTASNAVLSELEAGLKDLRSQRIPIGVLSAIKDKILVQTTRLSLFHETLRRHSQEQILEALEQMREVEDGEFQRSLLSDRAILEAELQKLGISEELIDEEFFFIEEWLKETYPNEEIQPWEETSTCETPTTILPENSRLNQTPKQQPEKHPEVPAYHTEGTPSNEAGPSRMESSIAPSLNEELPDYFPGAQQGTIEEKIQSLEQTTAIIHMNTSIEGMSSIAQPPPYTFEEGNDQMMDEEFSKYIRKATENEASRRFHLRGQHPEQCPQPYSWLPKDIQAQYRGRADLIQMMDAKSFTTMAYETAPKCNEEIDRLALFLRMSFQGKPGGTTVGIIGEATRALKSFSTAIAKFTTIQDQRSGNETFSDLDVLEFEFSTADSTNDDLHFPEREFELAQKTYYLLLTYIMGLVEVLSDLFPGRTYITRSDEQLSQLWKDKKMTARTAWVEKQLAAWNQIDAAVLLCRDWHRLRPDLQSKAISKLNGWRQAQDILATADGNDIIELTIISASAIPRPRIGMPNLFIRLVVYSTRNYTNNAVAGFRIFDSSSDTQKSLNPVWNKTFSIRVPRFPKMIDLEVHDRVMGMDKEITRVRIPFSFVPGVEQNFAGRSLIYGLDEEFEFKLDITDGKGKEREPPLLRVGMKWAGRISRVEAEGLPTTPPGKMFRADVTGIPMPVEERDSLSIPDDRSG